MRGRDRSLGNQKSTEPVAPSSGNPTDLRRSECHSESHQPRTLRTRCSADTKRRARLGQAPLRKNFAQFPVTTSGPRETPSNDPQGIPGSLWSAYRGSAYGWVRTPCQLRHGEAGVRALAVTTEPDPPATSRRSRADRWRTSRRPRPEALPLESVVRTTKKCTEPVSPSSSFPTDRRRSDCHSENLQPRALRTRCMTDSMAPYEPRQDPPGNQLVANCDFFFSHRSSCASRRLL